MRKPTIKTFLLSASALSIATPLLLSGQAFAAGYGNRLSRICPGARMTNSRALPQAALEPASSEISL